MWRRGFALIVLAALAGGCGGPDDSPAGRVRIATGSPTAVYHAYGSAIAELVERRLPDAQPTVLVTAASEENVNMVMRGDAEVGFTQADIASNAGIASPSPVALVALGRLYDDYLHLVVPAGLGRDGLDGLRGKRVSIGPPGSGTAVTAARLLDVVDPGLRATLHIERLGLDDSAAAMSEGRIDAFFFSGGLPVAAIARHASTNPIDLVDLSQYVVPMRKRHGEYYVERVVPGQTYGVAAMTTIGVPNYLVVRADMPENLAYALTRLLFEGRTTLARAHPAGARLNVRSAITTPPLELHPGAARYYRDRKN